MTSFEIIIFIITFCFGLIIGSFLNVVILRCNTGVTLGGRSKCFSCRKQLCWYELIPLVSFLVQSGRCRNCHSPISLQYFPVELITGSVFALISLQAFSFSYTIFLFTVFAILIVISVYDLHHKIIPDRLVTLFGLFALASLFFTPFQAVSHASLFVLPHYWDLLAGIIIPLPFALLSFFSKGRLMGLGDPKLMIGIGWLLGLEQGIVAVLIAFWIGGLVGIVLIIISRIDGLFSTSKRFIMKSEIPFGPFLVLGVFVTIFTYEPILRFLF